VRLCERPARGLLWFHAYRRELGAVTNGGSGSGAGGATQTKTVTWYSRMPATRPFEVFNVAQTQGLPSSFYSIPRPRLAVSIRLAQEFLSTAGARITHGGNRAAYFAHEDEIQLPHPEQFDSMGHYYTTSFHEHAHWTGHKSRLARTFGRRGSDEYAFEELVAEFGSAFLCALLGLQGRLRHAGYIQHWARVLEAEPNTLFWATHHAEAVVEHLESIASKRTGATWGESGMAPA
jgi:antirestriction protein ArdC